MPLQEVDLPMELQRIERLGFVRTLKSGDTGVGFTLEALLGLRPTNVRGVADLLYHGEPVELKTKRLTTDSMLTLFTCEPETRLLNDYDLIRRYGYPDAKGRPALKITFGAGGREQHGLKLIYDPGFRAVSLVDAQTMIPQWLWPESQFSRKLENLLFVRAEVQGKNITESFRYSEATLYRHLNPDAFAKMVAEGSILVDLRAHIKPGKTVARNHGTGFRMRDPKDLVSCYESVERML